VSGPSATLPDEVAKTRTEDRVDVLMWSDCRITISELFSVKGDGKAAGMVITRELGYEKVCVK
jgi:hypothetical protein